MFLDPSVTRVCVVREVQEECGLLVPALHKVALLMFEFVDSPQLLEVHVFHTDTYTGQLAESDGQSHSLLYNTILYCNVCGGKTGTTMGCVLLKYLQACKPIFNVHVTI